MKKQFLIAIISMATFNSVCGQSPANVTRTMSHLDSISNRADTRRNEILTNRAINILFAKKVANYLSGDNDLSLYKSYAIADIGDGKLLFGKNFQIVKNETGRVSDLITAGIKANAKESFAKLYSKGKFAGDIGFDLKYTHIFKGKVFFDRQVRSGVAEHVPGPQQEKMRGKRQILRGKLENEMIEDSTDFVSSLTRFSEGPDKRVIINEFLEKKSKTVISKFAEMEADEFEEDDKSHNKSVVSWVSISGYIPITNSKYTIADSFTTTFNTVDFRPFEGNVAYSLLKESKRRGRYLFTVGAGAFLNNGIKNEDIEQFNINTYKNLGGVDTIHLAQIKNEEVYVGKYEKFITGRLKAQVVYFLPCLDWIGIDLNAEKLFGKFDPLNAVLGFPLVLEGKDKDKKVNIELKIKAFDLSNTIKPDQNFNEKLTIGLSVGLPFGSIIY